MYVCIEDDKLKKAPIGFLTLKDKWESQGLQKPNLSKM